MTLAIAARPFTFHLQPGHAALVVIDMQRDFIEPGGFGASLGNDVSHLEAAIAPTRALLDAWRARGWPIVHTRESHAADLSDCPPAKRDRGNPSLRIGDPGPMGRLLVRGEPGCDIVPSLAPLPGEIVIDKPGKGAFYATGLGADLQRRGVTQLVFAGVTTEVCVQTTMREANDRGYDGLLIEEATASYFPHFKAAAIEMIVAQGGIVGWAAKLEDLLSALPAASARPSMGAEALRQAAP
jgi:biuret amidohydrolase